MPGLESVKPRRRASKAEQAAKAPREFDVQARNPAHTVHIGGDHMVFSPVYGCASSAPSTLDSYQPPPLDDAIRAELDDFVTRRRRELSD